MLFAVDFAAELEELADQLDAAVRVVVEAAPAARRGDGAATEQMAWALQIVIDLSEDLHRRI